MIFMTCGEKIIAVQARTAAGTLIGDALRTACTPLVGSP